MVAGRKFNRQFYKARLWFGLDKQSSTSIINFNKITFSAAVIGRRKTNATTSPSRGPLEATLLTSSHQYNSPMTDNEYIPDFSGDDFANDKEIQKNKAAIKAYEKMIEESLTVIRQELKVQDASHINFKGFHMFKSLSATITHSMKSTIPNKELRVSLAEYYSAAPTAKSSNSGSDLYLFGHISLKTNYPSTYIHKETIKEKIEDIILKRDVDFSNSKKFSRRFQLLTEDKKRLQDLLQFKNLDDLTGFPEMEIELSNATALFRTSRKPISIEEATIFCDLTKLLLTIFN
jgi:hypothetical protein